MATSPDHTKDEGVVFEREREYLQRRRAYHRLEPLTPASGLPLSGLCLSGGGIRSATFALGVMQAFARKNLLKNFDYLSTVSGGGYIGSALTWALHRSWDSPEHAGLKIKDFGVDAESFPFGTRRPQKDSTRQTIAREGAEPERSRLVRHISQHGSYLTPGDGIDRASLIAVVLRSSVTSLLVYFPLLTLIFAVSQWAGVFGPSRACTWIFERLSGTSGCGDWCGPGDLHMNSLLFYAAVAAAFFVAASILYSLCTFLFSSRLSSLATGKFLYRMRRGYEKWIGGLLVAALGLALVGVLPYLSDWLNSLQVFKTAYTGGATTLGGLIASVFAFLNSRTLKTTRISPSTWAKIAATLLLAGVFLLAYQSGIWLCNSGLFEPRSFVVLLPLLAVPLGFLSDINAMSIHRYYRDRLMEAFLPDMDRVIAGGDAPVMDAQEANKRGLYEMCDLNRPVGPYHLINANLVLVDAADPELRGRGGDNFLLSPIYCGSRATGWRSTKQFLNGGMTLSTAMAISGAAVNPNTGAAGGVTRDRLTAALMGLLGIGLGYWVDNPDPRRSVPFVPVPNYLYPGIAAMLPLGKFGKFRETARRLQLSDGGHFENLALYELLRREVKLIVVCDGGADPEFTFSDLASVIERARNDFGAKIEIASEDLVPVIPVATEDYGKRPAMKLARQPFLFAKIRYASDPDDEDASGRLIYLNTVFFKGLPADLLGYKLANPEYPDQPTLDQFFDERQFEAYRELGYQVGKRVMQEFPSDGTDQPVESTPETWWRQDRQLTGFFIRPKAG